MTEPDLRIDALVLQLYRGGSEVPFARFQHWALERLQTLLRFDAAWWGRVHPGTRQVLGAHLFNADPSILEDHQRVEAHDRFRDAMIARPGRTVLLSDLMPRAVYERTPLDTRYGRRHRLESATGTVLVEPVSGLLDFLTVWRFDSRWPFAEGDRALAERLTPHLIEANRISRRVSLRGGTEAGGPPQAERPWAMASARDGVLLEVNTAFVAMLREEWPSWRDGQLPAALRRHLSDAADYAGRTIAIAITAVDDYRLLVPRPRHAAERLGTREALVLERYAMGRSYRDIATELGSSPATVRNQLARIDRKLGVHNKAERVRSLQVSPPPGGTGA